MSLVEKEAFGRRAAAVCNRFRWMPRMQVWEFGEDEDVMVYSVSCVVETPAGTRLDLVDESGGTYCAGTNEHWPLPDCDDPSGATEGCFYRLLLEAWGAGVSIVEHVGSDGAGCLVLNRDRVRLFEANGGTRMARILAALERVP